MPFLIILAIILIAIISAWLKSPKRRGRRGERCVSWAIGETVEGEQYVINDLIVSTDGKTTSQIDHIVINPQGVFVIETKNYSGIIYGSEHQREWTQVLAYGNTKNKLYNPLKQNATHVYKVKKIVGDLPVHSLVVFVQNNTQHIQAANVIPLSELESALEFGIPVLSVDQMEKAYNLLLESALEISTEEHVENITMQKQSLEQGVCPRCGGTLVLRSGQYGEFWGCSSYPKCKFTKKY